MHGIILWDPQLMNASKEVIAAHSPTTEIYDTSVLVLRDSYAMCREIYVKTVHMRAHENCHPRRPIGVIVLNDTRPLYGWARTLSTYQNLNLNMLRLKSELRRIARNPLLVHGSVNQEEAFIILRHTGHAHLTRDRPRFSSMRSLFEFLNRDAQLKYVVQRWWLEVLDDSRVAPLGKDVDLLVDDYYYFKRVTGARSVNPITMRENNNGGNIQNTILVNNAERAFDVRYIGDGYNDWAWQRDMLQRRVLRDFLYIPSAEDAYFSLLYHVKLQKVHVTNLGEKLTLYLRPLARTLRVPPITSINDPSVERQLAAFLRERAYGTPCPHDPAVLLRPLDGRSTDAPRPGCVKPRGPINQGVRHVARCGKPYLNGTNLLKRSAVNSLDVRCAPMLKYRGKPLYPFPKFCDWVEGEYIAYLVSEVLGMHLVPTTQLQPASSHARRHLCLKQGDRVSVQKAVALAHKPPRLTRSNIEGIALLDTLTDNCDRFSSSAVHFRTVPLRSLVERTRFPTGNIFALADSKRLIALDNAKSLNCASDNSTVEEANIRRFWEGWGSLNNGTLIHRVRKLYSQNTSIASLLIAKDPSMLKFRDALNTIDRRARILLQLFHPTRS